MQRSLIGMSVGRKMSLCQWLRRGRMHLSVPRLASGDAVARRAARTLYSSTAKGTTTLSGRAGSTQFPRQSLSAGQSKNTCPAGHTRSLAGPRQAASPIRADNTMWACTKATRRAPQPPSISPARSPLRTTCAPLSHAAALQQNRLGAIRFQHRTARGLA